MHGPFFATGSGRGAGKARPPRPAGKLPAMLDERWIRSLHVESMRHADLQAEHAAHVLFQASTIGALLEGSFDGDLSFAERSEERRVGKECLE